MNCVTPELKAAIKISIPTFLAYFPFGMVFAFICEHQGYPWYVPILMSAIIYGGSVQFIAISMLSEHAATLAIVLAASFVALRNSFYGLSLVKRYQKAPFFLKSFLIFGLVDATYAMLNSEAAKPYKDNLTYSFYVTLMPYLYWIAGTAIGVFFADLVPAIQGLDFILPAFFMALVLDAFLINRDLGIFIIPLLLTLVCFMAFGKHYLLFAMLLSIAYLSMRPKPETVI